jgi:hypothetical protein
MEKIIMHCAISIGEYRFGFVEEYVQKNPPDGCTALQTRASLGQLGSFEVPVSVGAGWAIVILAPLLFALFAATLARRLKKPT